MSLRRLVAIAGLLVVVGLAQRAGAQAFQGTVRVTVRDAQGGIVAGAEVRLVSDATDEKHSQVSNTSGVAEFPNMLPGTYTVSIEQPGFKAHVRKGVVVRTNQIVDVAARLELGDRTEAIEVSAGAELVNVTSSQLEGGTFGARQVTDLPVYDPTLTGDVTNFAVLAPGVVSQPGGVVGQGGAIGGNRPRQNNFVVDGLDNNEHDLTGSVVPVIQDSVAEFTLLTNQFTAEFGHSTAGQFITTTKTGTNEIHGGLWEYSVNRNFLSLDNLTRAVTEPGTPKPRYDNNRFGGQLGGPLIRDRLFAYGAYEYQTVNKAGTVASEILVPTAGGMSTLESMAGQPRTGVSSVSVGLLRDWVPTAGAGTTSVDVLNEATGTLVPVEVGPFAATSPNFDHQHLAMLNLDGLAGEHRVSGRFSYFRYSSLAAGPLPIDQFNSDLTQKAYRAAVSDVWNLRPDIYNELRVGYTKLQKEFPVSLPSAPGATDVFGNYIIDELGLNIGPVPEYPQDSRISTFQAGNTTTWVHNAHTFKGGVEVRANGSGGTFLPRGRGEYNYASLGELVRDQVPAGSNGALRGVGADQFIGDRKAFYAFAQDSWRVHKRLTLDLGLRYEVTQVPKDSAAQAENAISNIDSIRTEVDADGNVIFDQLTPAHQQLLLQQVGESLLFAAPKPDRNNFSPRFGFAWDATNDGRTSVRGGIALAYDVLFGNLASIQLPPQYQVEVGTDIACTLSPSPEWCSHVNDVRSSTGGFLAGGALLNVVDPTTRTDRAAARAQTGALIHNDKSPETITWSLSLQRQFARHYMLEVRYVGTHGRYLPIQRRLNAGIPLASNLQLPVFLNEQEALARDYTGAPTLDQAMASAVGLLEPYGFYGTVTEFVAEGKSWYNGVSLSLERQFAAGLGFNANYTYSRTEDYGENELFTSLLNPRRPFDSWDLASNRGLSGLHKPHKASLSWVWDIPKPRVLAHALGGWSLTGTLLLESGQALTVRSGRDLNLDFDSAGDRAFENPNGTPNTGSDVNAVCWDGTAAATSPLELGCGDASVVGYVAIDPTAQFIAGGPGGMVGVGLTPTKRGDVIGPGPIHVLNLGLFKTVGLGGSRKLRFGVQAINVTNTPSFALGSGSAIATNASVTAAQGTPGYTLPTSPQFLRKEIFSGGLGQSPFQRIVQFQVKVDF